MEKPLPCRISVLPKGGCFRHACDFLKAAAPSEQPHYLCTWLLGNPIAGVWHCPQALSPCRVSIPSGGHTAQPSSIPTDDSQVCEGTAHGTAVMRPLEGMWSPMSCAMGIAHMGAAQGNPLCNSQHPSAALGPAVSQCRIILRDAPFLRQLWAVLGMHIFCLERGGFPACFSLFGPLISGFYY